MLEQPKAGLISRFYRQFENRLKNLVSISDEQIYWNHTLTLRGGGAVLFQPP